MSSIFLPVSGSTELMNIILHNNHSWVPLGFRRIRNYQARLWWMWQKCGI